MTRRMPMGVADDPVAVTGIGVILPGAPTLGDYWDVLRGGVSQALELTEEVGGAAGRTGCEVKTDPTVVLSSRETRRMDRFSHLAVYAGLAAVADAAPDAGVDRN
ncbi:MAG TPA: beta-ketoacyl synthase N-terminal-like domain-containing protein, partial [Candidatus Limnocylindrales bacterium]|nr:beta-ketoacyl synthase N-terminal-like domain-containing protein [Candidatus Limnocylindrales bacterium]